MKPNLYDLTHGGLATFQHASKPHIQVAGGPAGDGRGVMVGVWIKPDLLAKLDELRGGLTRPEAIRRLLREVK